MRPLAVPAALLPLLAFAACPVAEPDDDDSTPSADDDSALVDDDDLTPSDDDDSAGPCADDAWEDNDDAGTATPLPPGTQEGGISCPNDDDWFAVDVPAGGQVLVTLVFSNDAGDLDLELIHPQDGVVDASATTGDVEEAGAASGEAITLFARVYTYEDGGSPGNAYSISLVPSLCPVDAFEPDDSREAAAALEPGTWTDLAACFDDDWYEIALTTGDALAVEVDFSNAEGDVDAALHDAEGELLDLSESTSDHEVLGPLTLEDDAIVFLRVYLYEDLGTADGSVYSLGVSAD